MGSLSARVAHLMSLCTILADLLGRLVAKLSLTLISRGWLVAIVSRLALGSIIKLNWLCHNVVALAVSHTGRGLILLTESEETVALRDLCDWITEHLRLSQTVRPFVEEVK